MLTVQIFLLINSIIMFDFNPHSDLSDWYIVNDDVMGGRSSGQFFINESGYGQFEGLISLENYGGFSSVRYRFSPLNTEQAEKIVIRVKGDGKNYQLRIKSRVNDYYSYVYEFETTEDWIDVIVPLNDMEPTFRGRKLNMDNFNEGQIEELGILIGNKKAEYFKLQVDKIELI